MPATGARARRHPPIAGPVLSAGGRGRGRCSLSAALCWRCCISRRLLLVSTAPPGRLVVIRRPSPGAADWRRVASAREDPMSTAADRAEWFAGEEWALRLDTAFVIARRRLEMRLLYRAESRSFRWWVVLTERDQVGDCARAHRETQRSCNHPCTRLDHFIIHCSASVVAAVSYPATTVLPSWLWIYPAPRLTQPAPRDLRTGKPRRRRRQPSA